MVTPRQQVEAITLRAGLPRRAALVHEGRIAVHQVWRNLSGFWTTIKTYVDVETGL